MSGRAVAPAGGGGGVLAPFRVVARHPKRASVGFLWLLGLCVAARRLLPAAASKAAASWPTLTPLTLSHRSYAVFLAPAPVRITPAALAEYKAGVAAAQGVDGALARAEGKLADAQWEVRRAQAWCWRLRPEHAARVAARRPAEAAAAARVAALRAERESHVRAAKAALGLWSDAGLEEARSSLWRSFENGKVFARRQTFWDSLFHLIGSRDKDWPVLVVQLLFTALINYSVGAVTSVFFFAAALPGLLRSFGASWLSGSAFFAVAVIGAVSLVASYLAVLYAAGGAVLYTTASFARAQRARLGPGGGGARPTLRQGQYGRSHWE